MRILSLIFITVLVAYSVNYSQSTQMSLIIENAFLYTDTKTTIDNYSTQFHTESYKKALEYWPLAFYVGVKFALDDVSQLELRPGFQAAGEYFSGAELGLFYRKYVFENIFAGLGLLLHFNFGGGHGNMRSVNVKTGLYANPGILFGARFFKDISAIVSVYKTTDHFYGTIFNYALITGESKVYRPELIWVFKFGFEINLN